MTTNRERARQVIADTGLDLSQIDGFPEEGLREDIETALDEARQDTIRECVAALEETDGCHEGEIQAVRALLDAPGKEETTEGKVRAAITKAYRDTHPDPADCTHEYPTKEGALRDGGYGVCGLCGAKQSEEKPPGFFSEIEPDATGRAGVLKVYWDGKLTQEIRVVISDSSPPVVSECPDA